nr:MAG TPA: hypothetical protein [Caudoviricetes sp.]
MPLPYEYSIRYFSLFVNSFIIFFKLFFNHFI